MPWIDYKYIFELKFRYRTCVLIYIKLTIEGWQVLKFILQSAFYSAKGCISFFFLMINMEIVCSIDVLLRGITHRVFEFEFYSKTALLSLAFSLHVFSLFSKTHMFAGDVVIIVSINL